MQETEAGLIVPDGTIRLGRTSIDKNDWRKIRKALRVLESHAIHAIFVCAHCAQRPATPGAKITQSYFQMGHDSRDGSVMLKCNCRVVVTA